MELWIGALSWWKYHWPDLKSAGLFQRNFSWTPLKPQHSIPCLLSVQWEPSACRSCQCCQKKGSSKVCGWICSVWPWVWESQHASTGNFVSWSLGHSSRSSFHHRLPEHQEPRDLNWSARLSPCCHDNVFLIFSEHPWDKLRANLPHLQFLVNNCVYSSHTDIKLCTYCLYRHTTVLIHEIFLFSQSTLVFWLPYSSHTSHHPSQTPCLPWISYATWFMQDGRKAVWSIPYISVTFFPSLKQNFNAYRSSKVSSRPDCIF